MPNLFPILFPPRDLGEQLALSSAFGDPQVPPPLLRVRKLSVLPLREILLLSVVLFVASGDGLGEGGSVLEGGDVDGRGGEDLEGGRGEVAIVGLEERKDKVRIETERQEERLDVKEDELTLYR